MPQDDAAETLCVQIHFPRLVDVFHRDSAKLRNPLLYKLPVVIVLNLLFNGIVNTNGVRARRTGLHLKLGIMNPRFVVQKQLGDMMRAVSPVLIKMMTQDGYEHRPHPEVNPAGFSQTAHECVDKREAGLARFPGFQEIGIISSLETLIAAVYALGFVAALDFELLDEVTVPFESHQERGKGTLVFRVVGMVFDEMVSLLNT